MAKRVCPEAMLAAHNSGAEQREGVTWSEEAMKKGLRPIMDIQELLKSARR